MKDRDESLIEAMMSYTMNSTPELRSSLNYYKFVTPDQMTNRLFFGELTWVIYSSGFRNDIIRKYWPSLSHAYMGFDVEIIARMNRDLEANAMRICKTSGFRNLKKAQWCIQNAERILTIDEEEKMSGGLRGYLLELSRMDSLELVNQAKEIAGMFGFKGIGSTTIFHLLKNVGLDIFKPDIHVRRVLSKLKFIESSTSSIADMYEAISYLSRLTGMKFTELDTLLFTFGKIAGDDTHVLFDECHGLES